MLKNTTIFNVLISAMLFGCICAQEPDTFKQRQHEDQPLGNPQKTITKKRKNKKSMRAAKPAIMALGVAGIGILGTGAYFLLRNNQSTPAASNNAPKSVAESRILGFYYDTKKIDIGSNQPLSWSDAIDILRNNNGKIDQYNSMFFEGSHSFIQWLFPTKQPSKFNGDAEVLTDETIDAFKNSPELMDKLVSSFVTVVHGYYKLDINVTQATSRNLDQVIITINDTNYHQTRAALLINGGHNLLRITRILNSMRLLGLENYAKAFFACLCQIHERPDIRPQITQSFGFWKNMFPQ